MRRKSVIFLILLGIVLSAGCSENGAYEPEPAETPLEVPVETPVIPAEVPQATEEIFENPVNNASNQTPVENLTLPEPENISETPETPETQAEPRVVEVEIENFSFNPESVTISPYDTVRWTNLDPITHTVTGPEFASGTLRDGDSFELTFTKKGIYKYYCSIHPSMEGVVIVEDEAVKNN